MNTLKSLTTQIQQNQENPESPIVEPSGDFISPQEAFVTSVNQCPLCGSDLRFKHNHNHLDNKIREDADCPSCQIRIKSKLYPVQ